MIQPITKSGWTMNRNSINWDSHCASYNELSKPDTDPSNCHTHTQGIEITFTFFRDSREHNQCSNITYCRLKICVYSGCFKSIKTEMYPHSTGRRSCLHHKQWALWPGNSGQPVLPRISKVSKKKQIGEQTIYCCQLFSNPPEKLSAFASALLDIWCYPA